MHYFEALVLSVELMMQCIHQLGFHKVLFSMQEVLESVQKRAARFVTVNYNYEIGSMTGILV